MKPTDFSKYLTDFLIKYLPHEKEQELIPSIPIKILLSYTSVI